MDNIINNRIENALERVKKKIRENEFTTRQVAMLRTVEMLREELK